MLEVRKTPDTPDTPDIPLKHRLPIDYTPDGPLTRPLTPLTGPLTPLTGPLTPLTVLLVHALYTITIHLYLSSPPKSLHCSSAPPLPFPESLSLHNAKASEHSSYHYIYVYASICKQLPAVTSSYQQLPVLASICQYLIAFASSYQYLPAFAST